MRRKRLHILLIFLLSGIEMLSFLFTSYDKVKPVVVDEGRRFRPGAEASTKGALVRFCKYKHLPSLERAPVGKFFRLLLIATYFCRIYEIKI